MAIQKEVLLYLLSRFRSGMPILSTTHCDIPEVVLDGRSGYLVPEKDIHALSEKLEYLVKHPKIWPEMGQAGREHVEKIRCYNASPKT